MSVDEQVKATKAKEKKSAKEEAEEEAQRDQARNERRESLRPLINKLVEYNDGGARIGYLIELFTGGATIQPVGTVKGKRPDMVTANLFETWPCNGPTKYPTLADWVKACGWEEKEKVKPTLIIPGAKPAPKRVVVVDAPGSAAVVAALNRSTNIAIQQAAAEIPLPADVKTMIHDDVIVASSGKKEWNPERAAELFKAGVKIKDIAVEMGYEPGQGQNRTRGALKKAGLL
jgi:hypothetical protein